MPSHRIGTRFAFFVLTSLPLALIAFSLFMVSFPLHAEASSLPEVANLRFLSDKETLAWDSLAATEGYHVYRGDLSGLRSGDYGDCLQGSLQGTSYVDPEEPAAPGACFFYLVAGFDEEGEGSLGTSSSGLPRVPPNPCIPARRFFDLTINGNPGDGVNDGKDPARNPNAQVWSSSREITGVYLHAGEFFLATTDLSIPGRGWDWSFSRSYRSQAGYNGPLGHGWDFTDNARLVPLGADILFLDGTGRSDHFNREDATHFGSPAGLYAVLKQNTDGTFTLRYPNGDLLNFYGLDGSNLEGAIETMQDSIGNRMTFNYDHQGLLRNTTDSMGRAVSYAYDSEGRLTTVTDYASRSCIYSYDLLGNLASVRSPIVTGTPNGNDFPSGKTTTYTYSSSFADERSNHNLLSVIPPNELGSGLPELQNSYETDPTDFHFDRVVSQTIGGTNASGIPAGGVITYAYQALNAGADPNDTTIQRRKATVTDRNGNLQEHIHNCLGNLLQLTEFTNRELRPGEPDYITVSSYNADGEVLETTFPEGNRLRFTYDDPGADRYREGNVLEIRIVADPLPGGRGDGHGGIAPDIFWTYAYEPVFNQLATQSDPRGNDPGYIPQNGGTSSPGRYRTSWSYDYQEGDPTANGINDYASRFGIALGSTAFNLGDLNGDGSTSQTSGHVVRIDDPTVTLGASSHQAAIEGDTSQEIATLFQYNDLGQITATIDAEKNRDDYSYYPETDPDGDGTPTPPPPDGRTLNGATGGYLKTQLLDTAADPERNNKTNPTPASIREDLEYDPRGNLIGLVDGRGVRTSWIFNELDQIVQEESAAATADASGPGGSPPTGRGETGLIPFGFKARYEYDADDNVVRIQHEDRDETRGLGAYIDTTGIYDLLDNLVESQHEAASAKILADRFRYDANENLIRQIFPAGNSGDQAYDERDLLLSRTRGSSGPRGGTPSTTAYSYDGNGNLTSITDGRGNPIDLSYDGFDRPARWTDQVGNTVDLYYDPIGSVLRELRRGPVGGPTPSDRSGTTNVDLMDVRFLYEEMNRPFRQDVRLFVPAGVSPTRPAIILEGASIPGDGYVNTLYEYDKLSRPTFHVKDSNATHRYDHDGASRLLKLTDPGDDLSEFAYDADDNLIELAETEFSSSPGPPAELFLTTSFYDALGRRTTTVDNIGQTWRSLYDSLDAVVTQTDPNGPLSGTINRRSPGREGMSIPINSHGNVTHYTYDGADRMMTSTLILTTTGKGDGSTSPAPDTSNSYNPDGKIILTDAWDDNSLLSGRTDDRGNTTLYQYDNLDRLVRRTEDDETFREMTLDANDNAVSITDANGSVITNSYDNADRKTQSDIARAASVEGTTRQTFEYDGMDRLTRATDNNNPADSGDNSTATFLYDSLGRVFEEVQERSDGTSTKYSDMGWLAEDLATDLIYPSGHQIEYSYDPAERLISVSDTTRSESASFQYFGLSRIHTRSYANGIRSTMLNDAGTADIGYDGVARITALRHLDSSNSLLAGFEYRYDRTGNRTAVRRTHDSDGIHFKGELYGFDSSDRLTSFREGWLDSSWGLTLPALDEQYWTLDGTGNWPEMTRNGTTFSATPNNLNEYDEMQSGGTRVDDGIPDDFLDPITTPVPDGLNHAHDKNGNQVNTGLFDLYYDFLNRPVQAVRRSDGAIVAEYSYDALGRRLLREVSNSGDLNEARRYSFITQTAGGEMLPSSLLIEESVGSSAMAMMAASVDRTTVPGPPKGKAGLPVNILGSGFGSDSSPTKVRFGRTSIDPPSPPPPPPPPKKPAPASLWQIRSDGSSQYFIDDALGSTTALTEGTAPSVLERVTYDAYGRPVFEDTSNNPLYDPEGNFLSRSEYGNSNLFANFVYDPELGKRTADPRTDMPGAFPITPKVRLSTGGWKGLIFNYQDQQNYYWAGLYSDGTAGFFTRNLLRDDSSLWGTFQNPYSFAGGAPVNLGSSYNAAVKTPISVKPDGSPIQVQFNPEKLSVGKSVPWREKDKSIRWYNAYQRLLSERKYLRKACLNKRTRALKGCNTNVWESAEAELSPLRSPASSSTPPELPIFHSGILFPRPTQPPPSFPGGGIPFPPTNEPLPRPGRWIPFPPPTEPRSLSSLTDGFGGVKTPFKFFRFIVSTPKPAVAQLQRVTLPPPPPPDKPK